MAFWEILPLALLYASNYVSCMVKWEISNISLSVWLIGYQSHGILVNFAIGPAICIKLCLMYGQMGNFQYSSLRLACWLFKPWHLGKFHHWPCCVHQIMSQVWPNRKFLIFLFLFGTLAVKAMAFWEISLSSHQNLPFLKHVKISLII